MKMGDFNIIQACNFLLTSKHIDMMVTHFESRGEKWYLLLVLVGWHFLLRMMSEGFPLEKFTGREGDTARWQTQRNLGRRELHDASQTGKEKE